MLAFLCVDAGAGDLRLDVAGAGAFSIPVASLSEARWQTVVRQRYDFSCGSAAVATLLTYHYELPTSEEQVFNAMFQVGDQPQIRTHGFSMLDMKRYLDGLGLQADGFRMTLDKLADLRVPAIALVDTQGYKHFVVVRGIEPDRVLVADPAVGTVAVPRALFEQIWNGIVLAARQRIDVARSHFDSERDWQSWPRAPIDLGRQNAGLGIFTMTVPGRGELGR